jgi:hypothetical protein
VRQLTVKQVMEEHGGQLPPDATLRGDDGPERVPPSAAPMRPARHKRAGRFADLNAFADFGLAGLTGAEVKVWLILFRDFKAATGTARTGQTDIASRAGVSVRAVKHALRRLGKLGMVETVYRGGLNRGPSAYTLRPTGEA